jgi:hypothetical protein
LRSDRSSTRVARNGGSAFGTERMTAAARSGTTPGNTQGATGAQRAHMTSPTTSASTLTPTTLANNAAAEDRKPPQTKPVHQPWWHWIW